MYNWSNRAQELLKIFAHNTHPEVAVAKTWKGLTGQQKEKIALVSVDVYDAIHRTEAKLKEHNV